MKSRFHARCWGAVSFVVLVASWVCLGVPGCSEPPLPDTPPAAIEAKKQALEVESKRTIVVPGSRGAAGKNMKNRRRDVAAPAP